MKIKKEKPIVENNSEDVLNNDIQQFKDKIESFISIERKKFYEHSEQYRKWFCDEYSKRMPALENLRTDYSDGMIKRISKILPIKFMDPPDMTDNITVIFKLNSFLSGKEVNYGMLLCSLNTDNSEMSNIFTRYGNVIFKYLDLIL